MTEAQLIQVTVFLAAAAIAAPLGRFLRIGAVLGYLAAGVVIGPYVLGPLYALEHVEEVLKFVEFGVVLAQLQRRREDAGDLLPLDQLLDPPVGIVVLTDALQRLAEPGQILEVPTLDGLLQLQVDPLGLVVDARRGGRLARTAVGLPASIGCALVAHLPDDT